MVALGWLSHHKTPLLTPWGVVRGERRMHKEISVGDEYIHYLDYVDVYTGVYIGSKLGKYTL